MLTPLVNRFEAQLAAVKERLELAKVSTRGLGSPNSSVSGPGGFSFGGAGSRIAKPLRGGGGDSVSSVPAVAGLQNEGSGGKRSSWFFSGVK